MNTYQLPIDRIISGLGYLSSDNLFLYDRLDYAPLPSHAKKVVKEIHPYAAYILDHTPFVLFFDKMADDTVSFKEVSRQVWNAQIPIAVFCDESTVKIFNGLSLNMTDYTLKQINTHPVEDCSEDSDFSYWQISNPLFWSRYVQDYSETKLNQALLDNISYLTDRLKNTYHIPFATKLVLRLIFIRYLIDRGVDLDYENFSPDILRSQAEFLNIVRDKQRIYGLFAHLKTKFNGNLFELGTEPDCPALTDEVFTLLFTFFSGNERLSDRQLSLFALYDFNIIPVELISNIYEILLGKETRDKDNAFYTPNYLVEYILDKTVTKTLKEKSSFVILDPSCGSGVFLVDSYRRIVQAYLGDKPYCDDDTVLKQLLTDNIYGIDVNGEAIDVTIFSLYLTILDYKDPKTLSEFTLPNLKGSNLYVSDFFDEESLKPLTEKHIAFDYIIGNPPWGNVKDGLHISYCKEKGYADMQQNNEICRSFVFRAKDFCTADTTCCFILHSKILYTQKSPAVRFRQFLLKETEIQSILELSSVRKLVFEHADAPAAIAAFKYNGQNNLHHSFTYTSVKPNIFFELFHVLCIEKNDVKCIPQSMLFAYDWAWKTMVYGSNHDLEIILRLKGGCPTIKQALDEQTPPIIKGAGVEYQDGDLLDAAHLLGRKLLDSKTTMYLIKGTKAQKGFLLNLVGLLNSSLYAYLNLMLGTSIGIEREQRFMDEILSYPYRFSAQIAEQTACIQSRLSDETRRGFYDYDKDQDVRQLDDLVLKAFGLEHDKFIDYAVHMQIPELRAPGKGDAYRKVSVEELKAYSECFLKYFSTIYHPCGKYVSVTLYPDVGNFYTVFELHIKEEKPADECLIVNEADDEKTLLTKFSVYAHNDKFYQVRDVIHFGADSFFIIKPDFYKNWHPAVAELDLADVSEQIMTASGGDA